MTTKQKESEINKLWEISNNIELAKISAEDCHDIESAETIYNNTLNILNSSC